MGCWWLFVGWGLYHSSRIGPGPGTPKPSFPPPSTPSARSPGNLYSLRTKCSKRILTLTLWPQPLLSNSSELAKIIHRAESEAKHISSPEGQLMPMWGQAMPAKSPLSRAKKKAWVHGQEYLPQWPKSGGSPSQGMRNISWAWNPDPSYPSTPCKHCHPNSGSGWVFRPCLIFLESSHAKDTERLSMCSGAFSYFKSSMSIAH